VSTPKQSVDFWTQANTLLGKASDAILFFFVAVVLATLFIRLTPMWMDVLLALNLTLSVVILLIAASISTAVRLTSFPTILLLTTLLRLALNISTTKLILLEADAGQIIFTFGDLVVGGNFVVGAVVFVIITIVQFLVIAKGAERVAEVAARFTLDSVQGKQLSIDNDFRAGLLSGDEARSRRDELERESRLFGAMDGAMKFVKGDAIAGLIISAINIIAGLVVGVTQMGMSTGEAAETFSILTIGDGLVSQVAAVIVSFAAALLVTRVAGTQEVRGATVARDIVQQAVSHPPALIGGGILALVLGFIPGMPTLVFVFLSAVVLALGGLAFVLQARALPERDQLMQANQQAQSIEIILPKDAAAVAQVLSSAEKASPQRARLDALQRDLGLQPRPLSFALPPQPEGDARIMTLRLGGGIVEQVQLPLSDDKNPEATTSRMLVSLENAIRANLWRTYALDEAMSAAAALQRQSPDLVKIVAPDEASKSMVWLVMRQLLRERVPIADTRAIFEAIARTAAGLPRPAWRTTEDVRLELAPTIIDAILATGQTPRERRFRTIELDDASQGELARLADGGGGLSQGAVAGSAGGGMNAVVPPELPPRAADAILGYIEQCVERASQDKGAQPPLVVVAPPAWRASVSRLVDSKASASRPPVLSTDELEGLPLALESVDIGPLVLDAQPAPNQTDEASLARYSFGSP